MPKQYIGITGFGHRVEVDSVLEAVDTDRLVMVGVLMRGRPGTWDPDFRPNRHPKPDVLPGIFGPQRNALNMLHFTPLPGCDLYEHLCIAQELAGPHCHGFQLNTPWPDIAALARYKVSSRFRRSTVITLTVQPDALDAVGWDPKRIARKLKDYEGVADYVLVDPSAGSGEELDVSFICDCLDAITTLMPNVGHVAGGGLNADNVVEKLSGLLDEFKVSCDAEGKLRTKDDRLDIAESIRYELAADDLFRQY